MEHLTADPMSMIKLTYKLEFILEFMFFMAIFFFIRMAILWLFFYIG